MNLYVASYDAKKAGITRHYQASCASYPMGCLLG